MKKLYASIITVLTATSILGSGCSKLDDTYAVVGVIPSSDLKIVTYYPSYGRYASALTAADFLAKSGLKQDYATDEFVPSFLIIGDGQTRIGQGDDKEKLAWNINQFAFDDMFAWGGLTWTQNPKTLEYDGTISFANLTDAGEGNIAAALKQHDTKAYGVAIGGWPTSGWVNNQDPQRTGAFNRLGADPVAMDATMASLDNALYTIAKISRAPSGYHVDFEFPSSIAEGENLLKFCKALRAKVGLSTPISIAVSPNTLQELTFLPWTQLNAVVDHFEIMTYDYTGVFSGTTTAHHTPIQNSIPVNKQTITYNKEFNINSSVEYVRQQNIDAKKILIGVALYGRFWTGVTFPSTQTEDAPYYPTATQTNGAVTSDMVAAGFVASEHTIKYNRIQSLIASAPAEWVKHYDAVAKAAYIVNTTKGIFISYDNENSIAAKAAYVKEKGLGGVIVWDATGAKDTNILRYLRIQLDNN